MLMASLDLFDDIEDGELPDSLLEYGAPVLINAASAASFLGLDWLASASGWSLSAMSSITRGLWEACEGQARDLNGFANTPEEAWGIIEHRSGSLGWALAQYGVLAAGGTDERACEIAQIGRGLIEYAQVLNDLHDVAPRAAKRGDLAAGRRTFPILFAASRLGRFPGSLAEVESSGALAVAWTRARAKVSEARLLVERLGASPRFLELMPEASIG
jgi:geranylgeranyl pyrophosphate synthase